MKSRSHFGKLLAYFRHIRGQTQIDIARSLNERNFPISVSAIGKYEFGTRVPTPAFVYNVSRVLHLSEQEEKALLDACFADMTQRFMNYYNLASTQEAMQDNEK